MEGLEVRRGKDLGNFTNFFLKLVNFGCAEDRGYIILTMFTLNPKDENYQIKEENMGSLTKKIEDLTGQAEDEKEIKERLQMLLISAKAKIANYRDKINDGFINPAGIDKKEIPGIRAIRFIEQYHVAAQEGFSQQVEDHVMQAIDAFFSIGGKDQDTKNAVKVGIKDLILTALDSFIGSTEAGESQEKFYFVIPENNAIVRVDLMVWKYYMESQKIIGESDTAVAYLLCKSVVNHKELTSDELVGLVRETFDKTNTQPTGSIKAYIQSLRGLWTKLDKTASK